MVSAAFSEMVPVLHIVGCPSTSQQKERPLLHHTLGDGRFLDFPFLEKMLTWFRYDAYQKAAEQFVIHEAKLFKRETAATDIDRAITECITKVCS